MLKHSGMANTNIMYYVSVWQSSLRTSSLHSFKILWNSLLARQPLSHGTNVLCSLSSIKFHPYFMNNYVMKSALLFIALHHYISNVLARSYMAYPTVSCTNTHSNQNRLRINCTHISKHTSLWNCGLSPLQFNFLHRQRKANCLPASSLSFEDPGSCPLHLQFYWLFPL